MKFGQRVLFNPKNARSYLSNDRNLLDLVHPHEDLELSYLSGYIDNGGGLAPNVEITHNDENIRLRELPFKLLRDTKQPTFIKLQGHNQLPEIPYPTHTLPSHNEKSYLIRPDGHTYSIK